MTNTLQYPYMNNREDNYTIVLIDHSQLSREEWLDIKNGAGVVVITPYNDKKDETNDILDDAFLKNEAHKEEIRIDDVQGDLDE